MLSMSKANIPWGTMNSTRSMGFNTRAVKMGEFRDTRYGNVTTPIFENSTFLGPNPDSNPFLDSTNGKPFLYTRWGNPTLQSLEEKHAALEGAERSLSFSSGMSAISAAVLAVSRKGSRILSISELYGQTYIFFKNTLDRLGIRAEMIPLDGMNEIDSIPDGVSAVYTESVVNPTMGVSDLSRIAKACRESGVPLIVDATFCSPYNQRPLEFGASIVVHSATKYISGHSDVIFGLAAASEKFYHGLVDMRKTFGFVPDPIQAFIAARGMKTLGLRMKQHNQNAMELARLLSEDRMVKTVHYPGLSQFRYHEIASRVLTGFGGMLAFELNGGEPAARKFMRSLKIPEVAPSLGGVESLITLPVDTTHASLSSEERKSIGISDGLVRFSAGIEDTQDLVEDFKEALSALR